MHWIVPFAAPHEDAGREALHALQLPQLAALLGRLAPAARDEGEAWSFTPPHERVFARALGLAGDDGRLPFAAWQAAADGVDTGDLAWGLLTPAHWHLGSDQVTLLDPDQLALDEAASREAFEAIAPLFTSEGFVARWGAPYRWYVAHESLAALRTASLDRVVARNVAGWVTEDPAVRLVRRLQNEVQMLMYTHPLNDAREARGLLPVNSFWLSGCGVAQPVAHAAPTLDIRLRKHALASDWDAWAEAWRALDAELMVALNAAAARGEGLRLTLAGERSAVTLAPVAGTWRRLRRRFAATRPAALLETL